MNSVEMWRIYFDDIFWPVTSGHNDTDTSMLQPGSIYSMPVWW